MTTPRKPPRRPVTCRLEECRVRFRPNAPNHHFCCHSHRDKHRWKREKARERAMRARSPLRPLKVQHQQTPGYRPRSNVDCAGYNVCLTAAALEGLAKVPCVGCSQYAAVDIRATGPLNSFEVPAVGIDGVGQGNRRRGVR